MRKIGRLKGLKPLSGCRGYFHDGSRVYDRLGREVPVVDGKVKVLVDFQYREITLAKPAKRKKVISK
jgi:hypothetical protein